MAPLKAAKKIIPLVAFLLFVLAAFSPLQFLFNATYAQLSRWYPNGYVVAFVFAKFLFPVLLGIAAYSLLISKNARSTSLIVSAFMGAALFIAMLFLPIKTIFFVFIGIVLALSFYNARLGIRQIAVSLLYFQSNIVFNRLVAFLILVAVVARLAFAFWAENSSQVDAACRFEIVQLWSTYYLGYAGLDKILNPNVDWLPLHFYLSGLVWKLTHSQTALLVLHALAGIAGAVFLYKITRLFASRQISLLTVLAFLVYPANVLVTTAIMSEPWFVLSVLATVYFFLKLAQTDLREYYIFYALSVTCACLIRYEGWPLLFMFPALHIGLMQFRFNKRQLFFLSTLFAPLAIMYLNYYQGFHPLRGILYSDMQVSYCYDIIGRNLFVLVNGYKKAWVPGILALACYTVFKHRNNFAILLYAVIILGFSLPFIYKVSTFSIMPDFRYLIYYVILLLPLFIKGLFELTDGIIRKSLGAKILLTALIFGVISFGYQYSSMSEFKFQKGFNGTLAYVNSIKKGSFILDHHGGAQSYSWIALANLPIAPEKEHWYLKQFIDFEAIKASVAAQGANKRTIAYMVNDYESQFKATDYAEIERILAKGGDTYLVLFPNGALTKHLKFISETETYKRFVFKRVFEENEYRIYRLQ